MHDNIKQLFEHSILTDSTTKTKFLKEQPMWKIHSDDKCELMYLKPSICDRITQEAW